MSEPDESRERRPPGPGMDQRKREGLRLKAGPLTFVFSPAAFIACLLFGAIMAMPVGGASNQRPEPLTTLVCTFVVAAILLVHELGHAICLLAHGHSPLLVRFHGPGISETLSQRPIGQNQAWRVLLAGPAANVVTGGLLILCARASGGVFPEGSAIPEKVLLFGQYSLAFGILGLIPIPPLDAGVALLKAVPPQRHKAVHTVSAAVSLAVMCLSLALDSFAGALLAALVGMRNWRMRQADLAGKLQKAVQELAPLFRTLEEGWTALGAGKLDEARLKANKCLAEGKGAQLAAGACDLLAWVALACADPREAESCVEKGRRLSGGLYRALTLAMVLDAQGRTLDAITFARAAVSAEPSPTSFRLAFKLLRKQGFIPEALELLRSPHWPDKDRIPQLAAELEQAVHRTGSDASDSTSAMGERSPSPSSEKDGDAPPAASAEGKSASSGDGGSTEPPFPPGAALPAQPLGGSPQAADVTDQRNQPPEGNARK